jgi:hypothetical protein
VAEFTFNWNDATLNELRRGLHGPAAQQLSRLAIRCESSIKSKMGQVAPPAPPGHPPATRTGRLWGSITWVLGEDSQGVFAAVGTNVFYGPFLEGGTSRMAARPFLRPGVEEVVGPVV